MTYLVGVDVDSTLGDGAHGTVPQAALLRTDVTVLAGDLSNGLEHDTAGESTSSCRIQDGGNWASSVGGDCVPCTGDHATVSDLGQGVS